MTLGSGADQVLQVKDGQTKATIAGLEAKAASQARIRDIKSGLADPATSRRIRNEQIVGILALISIVAFTLVLFLVII
jgi:hypothetical protein